ncbi:MAG: putative aminohydrolase SsnA [Caldisericaceae bacterium]
MKIIGNCSLVTLDETLPFLANGAILEDNGKIISIAQTETLLKAFPDAEFINMHNKLVIPGLLNTHMHLYSTFARGYGFSGATPRTFVDILKQIWWKLDRNLSTYDEIFYSALVALLEGIKSGTTSIIDHHASFGMVDGSLDILEEALNKTGVRGVLAYEVSDRWGVELAKQSILENVRFIKKEKDRNSVAASFGLHASLTLSDYTLRLAKEYESSLNSGFHVHIAEGIEDVEDSLERSGKRVLFRLNDFGILGSKTLAVHCVHIDSKEIEILRETETMVVHNPESNMNNAVGVPPVLEMDNEGIVVGLGTDGYTPSMLESVKVAYILPKLVYRDPQVGWKLAKKMLFENNSKIFSKFFRAPLGVIKEGAYADFVALDYYPPTPLNSDNFFGHLIFGLRDSAVSSVFINGEAVLDNHKFTKFDEEEIMKKSMEVARTLWRKMES